MATSATPYGLRPINQLGAQPNSGGFRQIKIASAYDTSIFEGDVVKLTVGGTIAKDTGTTTATPIGVFMGCSYTDSSQGFVHKNMWTADTVASDAVAYVCDDPDMLFAIQADGQVNQNGIGSNFALVQGSGNATTGISGVSLDADSIADTATLPLRMVDYVDNVAGANGGSTLNDAYTDVIVKFVTHAYRTALGLADS